jgi:AcrR family transcriptional regulator
MSKKNTPARIVRAAKQLFGQLGYRGASMDQVAKAAGVSKGLLHYHFRSKEGLLVEAQKSVFKELHRRFIERASQGEHGVGTALDALDAMWTSIRDLRAGAPFVVETLSLGSQDGPLRTHMRRFYRESTSLLEDGIRKVFSDDLGDLVIPPHRMAVLIRILLSGLVVELAQARTEAELKEVDQAYGDLRTLFQQFVLVDPSVELDEDTESVPLPW